MSESKAVSLPTVLNFNYYTYQTLMVNDQRIKRTLPCVRKKYTFRDPSWTFDIRWSDGRSRQFRTLRPADTNVIKAQFFKYWLKVQAAGAWGIRGCRDGEGDQNESARKWAVRVERLLYMMGAAPSSRALWIFFTL